MDERKVRKRLSRQQQQLRSIRTLGVVIVVFLFCWIPFCSFWPISAFCTTCISLPAYEYSYWAAYLNSTVNPALYFIANKDFRNAFRKLIKMRSEDDDWGSSRHHYLLSFFPHVPARDENDSSVCSQKRHFFFLESYMFNVTRAAYSFVKHLTLSELNKNNCTRIRSDLSSIACLEIQLLWNECSDWCVVKDDFCFLGDTKTGCPRWRVTTLFCCCFTLWFCALVNTKKILLLSRWKCNVCTTCPSQLKNPKKLSVSSAEQGSQNISRYLPTA